MARDPGLEALIHEELNEITGLSERAMFGGWAWLLNGNLLCGARKDSMLVRLGKGLDGWALRHDGVAVMQMGGKTLHGWVRASPVAYGDDALRKKLLASAVEFVLGLPGK